SHNGKLALAAYSDGAVSLWRADRAEAKEEFLKHGRWLKAVTFSSDDKTIVTAADKTAILWDAASGEKLRTFAGSPRSIDGVAMSADRGRLLIGLRGAFPVLWDLKRGRPVREL